VVRAHPTVATDLSVNKSSVKELQHSGHCEVDQARRSPMLMSADILPHILTNGRARRNRCGHRRSAAREKRKIEAALRSDMTAHLPHRKAIQFVQLCCLR
jgi:hypothetical protein